MPDSEKNLSATFKFGQEKLQRPSGKSLLSPTLCHIYQRNRQNLIKKIKIKLLSTEHL